MIFFNLQLNHQFWGFFFGKWCLGAGHKVRQVKRMGVGLCLLNHTDPRSLDIFLKASKSKEQFDKIGQL